MTDHDRDHACTVPTVERPLRLEGFDQLFTEGFDHVIRYPGDETRVRLILVGGDDLERRARELTAEESSCCSFFRFGVWSFPDPGATKRIAMDVEVPPAHTAVLAALVDRAVAAPVARDALVAQPARRPGAAHPGR